MLVGALALLAWAAVVVRLVDVAVVSRSHWTEEAEKQQERSVALAGERGSIVDRDGRELAVSAPAWSAWIDPTTLGTPRDRASAAKRLAKVLAPSEETLRRRLDGGRRFAWLERRLSPERRDAVVALGIPGISFVKESHRLYPNAELGSDTLGVVGVDQRGLEGLEHALDDRIAGKDGLLLTIRDARGAEFLPGGLSFRAPERGADVTLTIDAMAQHVVERELKSAMARTGSKAGTVIVMFPVTGEVIALSNQPTQESTNDPAHHSP